MKHTTKFISLLCGAGALAIGGVAMSTAAIAADPVPVAAMAPEPEPEPTWTGGYVGGHAGLGMGALNNGTTCNAGATSIYFIVGFPGTAIDWEPICSSPLAVGGLGAWAPNPDDSGMLGVCS